MNETYEVGQQLIANGVWCVVDEINEDGTVWAIDRDGLDLEISDSNVQCSW
jgi:hypothetical protein